MRFARTMGLVVCCGLCWAPTPGAAQAAYCASGLPGHPEIFRQATDWAARFRKQRPSWSLESLKDESALEAFKLTANLSNSMAGSLQIWAHAKPSDRDPKVTLASYLGPRVTADGLASVERLMATDAFRTLKGREKWCVSDWTFNPDRSAISSRVKFLDESIRFTYLFEFRFSEARWRFDAVHVQEKP